MLATFEPPPLADKATTRSPKPPWVDNRPNATPSSRGKNIDLASFTEASMASVSQREVHWHLWRGCRMGCCCASSGSLCSPSQLGVILISLKPMAELAFSLLPPCLLVEQTRLHRRQNPPASEVVFQVSRRIASIGGPKPRLVST